MRTGPLFAFPAEPASGDAFLPDAMLSRMLVPRGAAAAAEGEKEAEEETCGGTKLHSRFCTLNHRNQTRRRCAHLEGIRTSGFTNCKGQNMF